MGTTRLRHGETVFEVVYSQDGKVLASVSHDQVYLWDAVTGRELGQSHEGDNPLGLALLPDGKTLGVRSFGAYQLRDWKTRKVLRRLEVPEGPSVCCLSADGKVLAVAGWEEGDVFAWDTQTGRKLRRLAGKGTRGLALTRNGQTLAAIGANGTLRVWDVATGKELHHLTTLVGRMHSRPLPLRFSPDGRRLAFGELRRVRLCDVTTGNTVGLLEGHTDTIHALDFSPDGKLLVTGSRDYTARLWDLTTGKLLHRFPHQDMVMCVAFSPTAPTVAVGDCGTALRLWDTRTGKELLPREGHHHRISSAALSSDGKLLATASPLDNVVCLWQTTTGKQLRRIKTKNVTSIAFAPDGRTLAGVSSFRQVVSLWDVATGRQLRDLEDSERGRPLTVAFAPDGKTLAASNIFGLMSWWEVASGRLLGQVRSPSREAYTLALSPDGTSLVAGAASDVLLWDLKGRKKPRWIGKHRGRINSVAFAPDGRTVAAAGSDDPIRLWDVASGRQVGEFERQHTRWPRRWDPMWGVGKDGKKKVVGRIDRGRSREVHSVCFTPDGRMLASAEGDDSVFLWEVSTGRPRRELKGHRGRVRAVSFAADGRLLASAGDDGTALIWDVLQVARGGPVAGRELDRCWDALAGTDATRAYQAVCILAATDAAGAWLGERLRPVSADDPRQRRLIAELERKEFALRQKTTRELEGLGLYAEAALRRALRQKPSLETRRRLEELLRKLGEVPSGESLRVLRALEALERNGRTAARRTLESLAKGAPEARLTREAKAALERLAHRRRN